MTAPRLPFDDIREMQQNATRLRPPTGVPAPRFVAPCPARPMYFEPRPEPEGRLRVVRLKAEWPTTAWITKLVSSLGYDGRAAVAVTANSWNRIATDRRKARATREDSRKSTQDIVADVAPLPLSRRTKQGDIFTAGEVTEAIGPRLTDTMAAAVHEVVYARQQVPRVAEARGIPLGSLRMMVFRVRLRARAARQKRLARTHLAPVGCVCRWCGIAGDSTGVLVVGRRAHFFKASPAVELEEENPVSPDLSEELLQV